MRKCIDWCTWIATPGLALLDRRLNGGLCDLSRGEKRAPWDLVPLQLAQKGIFIKSLCTRLPYLRKCYICRKPHNASCLNIWTLILLLASPWRDVNYWHVVDGWEWPGFHDKKSKNKSKQTNKSIISRVGMLQRVLYRVLTGKPVSKMIFIWMKAIERWLSE